MIHTMIVVLFLATATIGAEKTIAVMPGLTKRRAGLIAKMGACAKQPRTDVLLRLIAIRSPFFKQDAPTQQTAAQRFKHPLSKTSRIILTSLMSAQKRLYATNQLMAVGHFTMALSMMTVTLLPMESVTIALTF